MAITGSAAAADLLPAGLSERQRRHLLVVAAACVFTNFVGYLGLTALYPDVSRELRLSPAELGGVLGLSAVVSAGLQLPAGVLADRFGRRPLLAVGLLFLSATLLLRFAARTPAPFILSQLTVGFCSPLIVASVYASVADAYSGRGRGQALGIVQAAVNLGQAGAYLSGGWLGALLGWHLYSLAMAAVPLLLLPAVIGVREQRRLDLVPNSVVRGTLEATRFLVRPDAARYAGAAGLALTASIGVVYLLPFIGRDRGYSSGAISLLLIPFVAASVVGSPLTGKLADRFGPHGPGAAAALTGVAGCAALAAFGMGPVPIILGYALVGLAVGSSLNLAAVGMSSLAERSTSGTGAALGGLRLAQQIGPAFAPALAALALAGLGPGGAFLAVGGTLATTALLFVLGAHSAPDRRRIQ